MILIDGKKISEELKAEIAAEVIKMKASGDKIPHLAAILVGTDGASETYVAGKVKACELVGIKSTLIRLNENISETELLGYVDKLNNDADIDGFIVQMPLPKHISEDKVIEQINPQKDGAGDLLVKESTELGERFYRVKIAKNALERNQKKDAENPAKRGADCR